MKILLTQGAPYYPSYGGANKSNRLLLEALAAKGHTCCAVAYSTPRLGLRQDFQRLLAQHGVTVTSETAALDAFEFNGVEVKTVWEAPGLRHLWKQIRKMDPTWIVVSEDRSQSLLAAALKECPDRVIFISHSALGVPFGPYSGLGQVSQTDLLPRAAGIVS